MRGFVIASSIFIILSISIFAFIQFNSLSQTPDYDGPEYRTGHTGGEILYQGADLNQILTAMFFELESRIDIVTQEALANLQETQPTATRDDVTFDWQDGSIQWINTQSTSAPAEPNCQSVCQNQNLVFDNKCASGSNRPQGVDSIEYRFGTGSGTSVRELTPGNRVISRTQARQSVQYCYEDDQAQQNQQIDRLVACACRSG